MSGTIKLYSLKPIRPTTTHVVSSSISSPTSSSTTTTLAPSSSTTIAAVTMSARSVRSTSSSSGQNRLRKPQPRVTVPEPVHWLFRTNIPRRRQSYIPASPGRRNFFGMGEIVGVLSNPASTVRSLTESKRLLDEARREIQETRERSQIRPTHTFSRLPGFYPRKVEQQVIKRALEGEPSFTLLFGPPSAGKTALLREILSHPRYHVLHFDLRIAGFADLESLYLSLSTQMEGFFEVIAQRSGWYESGSLSDVELSEDEIRDEGWDLFEREAWGFKHDRINLQKRLDGDGVGTKGEVRPSDIARLMELFQSSLLRYREFEPQLNKRRGEGRRRQDSEDTVVGGSQQGSGKSKWYSKRKSHEEKRSTAVHPPPSTEEDERRRNWKKRVPVVFFDEAHKLPHLIPSAQTMQTILDSTLVLTKQDRLCHVVHATSDPFYQGWLSRVGVAWYCKMIAIGDLSKAEIRGYYQDCVVARLAALPPHVKRLDFETLYDAFGGKVAHWADFITDHVNSGGAIGIKQSSHFLQAHALLNLHIIHSSQAPGGGFEGSPGVNPNTTAGSLHGEPTLANMSTEAHRASPDHVLHPHLGPASFRMYQAGMGPIQATPSTLGLNPLISSFTPYEGVGARSDFSPMQLLKVMSRFTTGGLTYLPYFHLCRELGAKAVDAMIRGRVVDVKFTDSLPNLMNVEASRDSGLPPSATQRHGGFHAQERTLVGETNGVEFGNNPPPPPVTPLPHQNQPPPPFSEEDESMVPVSQDEFARTQGQQQQQPYQPVHTYTTHATHASSVAGSYHGGANTSAARHYPPQMDEGYQEDDMMSVMEEEEEEVIGPKIVPVSPIMRYAMREVIKEYQDDQSVSEYASLSDVDEY